MAVAARAADPSSAGPIAGGRRYRDASAGLLIVAAVQFVVLTVVAMVVYPGGAAFHPGSTHYLFFNNFFSDLGATRTYSGQGNIPSHVLFAVALGLTGLSLVGFSGAWRSLAIEAGVMLGTGLVAQVLAVVSGFGFVGIAATPWNLVYDAHNLFVRIAFGMLLLFVVCVVVIQVRLHWPRSYLGPDLAYLVILAVYFAILFVGPGLDTASGRVFQVTAQKIIVYATAVNLGLQALGVRAQSRARRG